MSPELLPLYLLVDLAGEPANPSKQASVDAFVQGFIGVLKEPDLGSRVRLTAVGFGRTVRRVLLRAEPAHASGSLPLPVEGERAYGAAFQKVAGWMKEDLAAFQADGLASQPPLLLVLADGPQAGDDEWETALQGLTAAHPLAVVRLVYHQGHDWGGAPVDPVAEARRIVQGHAALGRSAPRRPSPTKQETVAQAPQVPAHGPARAQAPVKAHTPVLTKALAPIQPQSQPQSQSQSQSQPQSEPRAEVRPQAQPPGRGPEPDWVGGFTPYSVGEPGAAALRVKPRPDPAEWDRRDTVLDGVYLHDVTDRRVLQLRAASVRGLSHRYNGTVRQDDYAFRCTDDRRHLVAVVSDGVSNSKLSHKAASVVTRLGAELVSLALTRKPPAEIDWPEIVTQLSDEIVRLGNKLVEPPPDGGELDAGEIARHLAATALFGVIDLRPVEPEVDAYFYAVGDSSAWVLRDGRHWQPMFETKNSGEGAATSVTKALPLSRPPAGGCVTTTVRKGDVVVLMSDGLGDPLEDGTRTVGRFLAEAWREPPAPLQFAAQVDFARKTHDDDRTAVAIWAV
ncbi:protein phosphatase 2C domain-containing protein [Dactylosporangium sp. NPDC050588]|uniref:protein phosphatase 2C domain-containing protein n=1 Tax=Dactylosporangium sp. NPDC050588 TaxID=3157211 RepID=UPI0033F2A635